MPTIPNLCGASPELDDTLTKLEDLESEITSQIDAAASVAAAAASGKVTTMKAALDGLALDLPELPPLNLQAELTSLLALPKTNIGEVLAYTSKLANIETNFGSELTSSGKSLTTLVTDATSALSGGGDLCAAVPNFEKAADGGTPAVEKAAAVLQASVPPLAEELSKIVANPNVVATVAALKEKTEKFATTANTEGFKGIGAAAANFLASAAQEVTEKSKEVTVTLNGHSITKKLVTAKESVVRTNGVAVKATVAEVGFSSRPKKIMELIKGDVDAFGNGLISTSNDFDIVKLKHKPIKISSVIAAGWVGPVHFAGMPRHFAHPIGPNFKDIFQAESNVADWNPFDTFRYIPGEDTIKIGKSVAGPYNLYAGELYPNGEIKFQKRMEGVFYGVFYTYNDTYDPNVKKS